MSEFVPLLSRCRELGLPMHAAPHHDSLEHAPMGPGVCPQDPLPDHPRPLLARTTHLVSQIHPHTQLPMPSPGRHFRSARKEEETYPSAFVLTASLKGRTIRTLPLI
ncbi:hypothetical protein PAXRUDRAFT_22133 [Paxillus rubicundulus Ve08.2h10]|uniref:Uncharacterized protein n=1 Tax=Paxillus rubicundulus Ve08.2h10 TaxID=930991 RepID=A0A0D0CY13_9AGAM|nr:hypothetical protein PAXRUDRAFT_22133 [Paxillus rubicundulus Ve08.2h10]